MKKTHMALVFFMLARCNYNLTKCSKFLNSFHLMLIFNAIGISHINYFNVLLMYLSKKDTDIINKQLIRTGSLILKLSKSKIDSTNWNLCIDLLNKYKNDLVKNLCNGKYLTIKNTLICSSSKT